MNGPPPAVEAENVSKRYGRTLALDAISLEVGAGEFFGLLGPNGAGKTTLVHILCTIVRPDSGNVRIGGTDVVRNPLRARRNLGVVFQEPSLDDRLTVYENLEFHGRVFGVPAARRRERIAEMLALVELSDRKDTLTRALSVGMKRRLEIARTLIHDSRILILDEPTVGLDAQSRDNIWRHVETLRRERGLTVVLTTHYIEEADYCDRVCIIDAGRVLALDTPQGLKARHGEETMRVTPRDAETGRELLAQYSGLAAESADEIVIRIRDPAFTEGFLAAYGNRVRQLAFETPSLESVFLKLTGRKLRDAAASPREHTLAFGRQGGEHTR